MLEEQTLLWLEGEWRNSSNLANTDVKITWQNKVKNKVKSPVQALFLPANNTELLCDMKWVFWRYTTCPILLTYLNTDRKKQACLVYYSVSPKSDSHADGPYIYKSLLTLCYLAPCMHIKMNKINWCNYINSMSWMWSNPMIPIKENGLKRWIFWGNIPCLGKGCGWRGWMDLGYGGTLVWTKPVFSLAYPHVSRKREKSVNIDLHHKLYTPESVFFFSEAFAFRHFLQ